jgi:hypothetical protein
MPEMPQRERQTDFLASRAASAASGEETLKSARPSGGVFFNLCFRQVGVYPYSHPQDGNDFPASGGNSEVMGFPLPLFTDFPSRLLLVPWAGGR